MAIEAERIPEEQGKMVSPDLPDSDLKAVEEKDAEMPFQREINKYIHIFQDEHSEGISPSQLQEKLEKAGFLKIENNKLVRGERGESGMILEAYKRALAERRERIGEEKEKYLNVLAGCKGNQKILDGALIKQGILKRKKDGELISRKGKSFEYKGYLQALDEYKGENTKEKTFSQKEADALESKNKHDFNARNVDSDLAYKYPKEK